MNFKRIMINVEHLFNNSFEIMKQHINNYDRIEIYRLIKAGKTQWEIAKYIGYAQSSISREIKKNSSRGVYDPIKAEKRCKKRRVLANKGNGKLVKNMKLKEKIVSKLMSQDEDWSPDTIAGRMKKEWGKWDVDGTW